MKALNKLKRGGVTRYNEKMVIAEDLKNWNIKGLIPQICKAGAPDHVTESTLKNGLPGIA
ncbi:hypothetical protein TWF481_003526 [Arthrobotrys musiformis]|uniref:Uncharacterized protein n=1 Tax=Arthrobotrys musiformis TaxID=47236 RepID=A0AAV9WHR6_9PEZI